MSGLADKLRTIKGLQGNDLQTLMEAAAFIEEAAPIVEARNRRNAREDELRRWRNIMADERFHIDPRVVEMKAFLKEGVTTKEAIIKAHKLGLPIVAIRVLLSQPTTFIEAVIKQQEDHDSSIPHSSRYRTTETRSRRA